MYTRLQNIPIYAYRDADIEAASFNNVQIALRRLGAELRFRIPKLRHLDLILQADAWIIVDRALNDMAIAAWTAFPSQRNNLHEKIPCRLQLYHQYASLVLKQTLEFLDAQLKQELAKTKEKDDHTLLAFPPRG